MINKKDNTERIEYIKNVLHKSNLDALVCSLPTNVLLLSGYWPVVGNAIALASKDGNIIVLAPSDEKDLTQNSWAQVQTFQAGSLTQITTLAQNIIDPLIKALQTLNISQGRIGFEGSNIDEPASYASMNIYGAALVELLGEVLPRATFINANSQIEQLRAVMTAAEQNQVRTACEVAGFAFQLGADKIRIGLRETEVAAAFEAQFSIQGVGYKQSERAGGFAFCMSGPNSALAGAAYARSRNRQLERGDLVLVHANSYIDGYWTDITRTYCLGEPEPRQREMYEAIFEAQAAAVAVIQPGIKAAEVDRAARNVLKEYGFEKEFTHGLGHNVGFVAINGSAPPRLHPLSPDTLEVGMVFNVEPAIYLEGYGGMRHCNVEAITADHVEVLTPFQRNIDSLIIK